MYEVAYSIWFCDENRTLSYLKYDGNKLTFKYGEKQYKKKMVKFGRVFVKQVKMF